MRNVKIAKGLIGPKWWKNTVSVDIEGDPQAQQIPEGATQEEKEKIIQNWKKIAVLEVEPKNIPFYTGFISGNYIDFLKFPIETLDGKFGMRIGNGAVTFFAFDPDFEKELKIRLVETVQEDDSRYKELPLY
jgi:hypothetical protein